MEAVNAESHGWFKAMRGPDALELIRTNRNAFVLAFIIANRARWREGFNQHGLGQGEAMLGDYKACGMSAREYRTAKQHLAKYGFATFQATNAGTIGKLIDTRLFSTSIEPDDKQADTQETGKRQADDKQATTNEEGKTGKKEINYESLGAARLIEGGLLELMEMVKEVLGQKEWKLQHGRWLQRAEKHPGKLRRVLADTKEKAKEDGLDNPAAWAEAQWKRFE